MKQIILSGIHSSIKIPNIKLNSFPKHTINKVGIGNTLKQPKLYIKSEYHTPKVVKNLLEVTGFGSNNSTDATIQSGWGKIAEKSNNILKNNLKNDMSAFENVSTILVKKPERKRKRTKSSEKTFKNPKQPKLSVSSK
jgi:hypothetical protein